MLGEKVIPVYYHSEHGKVVKCGLLGDNFGEVQAIKDLNVYNTYGYNTLPVVSKLVINTTVTSELV